MATLPRVSFLKVEEYMRFDATCQIPEISQQAHQSQRFRSKWSSNLNRMTRFLLVANSRFSLHQIVECCESVNFCTTRDARFSLKAELQIATPPWSDCGIESSAARKLTLLMLFCLQPLHLRPDRRVGAVFMLRLAEPIGVGSIGGVDGLIQQILLEIMIEPSLMRAFL